ncbi:hypothetical protein C2E23DRAFT_869376 [Lenzites betulinus]|nr:hypothetical protein C2E23DRAFT_869376 [Lenzites betulinus]
MKYALEFIRMLQGATLEGSNLPPETIEQIRNPPNEVLKIEDPDLLLWIQIYIAVGNASDETYNAVRDAIKARFPEINALTLYKVKKAIEKLSGVVGEVTQMCVKSCIGFTGPFAAFDRCHKCGEARYCPVELAAGRKVPRQRFLQAIFRSPEGIIIATPRDSPSLAKYFDLVSGQKLLECIANGTIGEHDLYRNKKSDCWIISPDKRYKKVYILPGAIIPGPNHPGVIDSFLFPGFYHVSALMREGLTAFNAALNRRILSHLFLALGLSDGPGMAMFNGCRAMCGLLGRHKLGCPHFYPALLRPLGDPVPGSDHGDILLSSIPPPSAAAYERNLKLLLSARNETQYKQLRKVTGLCKPTIMSGLSRTLPMPLCFPIDLMHLTCLNLPDLFLSLWRGTIQGSTQSDPKGWDCAILADPEVWELHGLHVERARHYLPGFLDRAPRNIAAKLNSGYKAIEFMTWFYNYVPAMLRSLLPEAYWLQFCKLARGIMILYAEDILPEELLQSKTLLTAAIEEYELLYYARDPDRLHVVRPAIHLIWHGPDQIVQIGAMVCDTQLPIERLIGDLGSEIKQPSTPYANLSQRAIRRCQVNALKAMLPEIDRTRQLADKIPRGAQTLGDGYILLCARDRCLRDIPDIESRAFYDYLAIWEPDLCGDDDQMTFALRVRKWARLRLPNGTVARSAWKEQRKPVSKLRLARCVKFSNAQGELHIGEIRYFCSITKERTVALVSVFGPRDEALYRRSHATVDISEYRGDTSLEVINVKQIESVVGMIPDRVRPQGA